MVWSAGSRSTSRGSGEDAILSAGRRQSAAGSQIDARLDPAVASGDASLVESLITNLLENAIRHNSPAASVEISTETTPDGPRLRVANTGAEVPPAELDRLFQTVPATRRRDASAATDGHGLGLAIVKAIADAHGASLTARSAPQGGLEVEVTFRAG